MYGLCCCIIRRMVFICISDNDYILSFDAFLTHVIFLLVLWILSSLWLNVSGAQKMMLIIGCDSREIYSLYLSKIKQ